jgi:hypothetical protein
MTEETARLVHLLLLKASGAIDETVATVQASGVHGEELSEYKHAAGRTMMAIFEELLMPIYREHPAVIPTELDRRFLNLDGDG